MKYLPLFELRIKHAYYDNGRSTDFVIVPTPETTRFLSNFRAMTISLPDGLRVVTSVLDSGDTLVALSSGMVLSFDMRLTNRDFALVTDARDIPSIASPLYSNVNFSAEEETKMELVSNIVSTEEKFNIVKPSQNEQFVLSGIPIDGVAVADFKTDPAEIISAIVAYDAQHKIITLDSRNAATDQEFTLQYPATVAMPNGVFARIHIHINAAFSNLEKPMSPPRQFEIVYRAKQAKWVYYCVTDNEGAATAYKIIDSPPNGGGAPLVFSESNRRDLVANPDSLDQLADELAQRYPGLKRIRFLSDAPVVCRQQARKHLKLKFNDNDLLSVLPNPSIRNFVTGRVKIDDQVEEQDWIYQIVKVLTHLGV